MGKVVLAIGYAIVAAVVAGSGYLMYLLFGTGGLVATGIATVLGVGVTYGVMSYYGGGSSGGGGGGSVRAGSRRSKGARDER